MTIVERSSGFWVVDVYGVVEGPFMEYEEALAWIRDFENAEKAYDNQYDSYANDWET